MRQKLVFYPTMMLILITVNARPVSASGEINDHQFSPRFTLLAGTAKTSARNYESSSYVQFFVSKPIMNSRYSLDVGWKRFVLFRHRAIADTGIETKGYTAAISTDVFKKRRLSVRAALTGLAYNSKTQFLNQQVDTHHDYTWGAAIHSSLNFRAVALNLGLEWHRDISNSQVSILLLGITFNLGPMFGF